MMKMKTVPTMTAIQGDQRQRFWKLGKDLVTFLDQLRFIFPIQSLKNCLARKKSRLNRGGFFH